MPKINVYLPDDLADAVKTTGLPVSAICQRALEQSVRRLHAARDLARAELGPGDPTARLAQATDRVRTAITLGIEQARTAGAPAVGTEHLLHGILAEGGNLAVQILRTLEVEPAQVARALATATPEPPAVAGGTPATRFTPPAAVAIEATVAESLALGHNYVGCEHLLLGLVAEPDGTAGRVLRELGIDQRTARQAVAAALTGYAHLRAQAATTTTAATTAPAAASTAAPVAADPAAALAAAVRQELRPVLDRIDRLEQHAGLAAE